MEQSLIRHEAGHLALNLEAAKQFPIKTWTISHRDGFWIVSTFPVLEAIVPPPVYACALLAGMTAELMGQEPTLGIKEITWEMLVARTLHGEGDIEALQTMVDTGIITQNGINSLITNTGNVLKNYPDFEQLWLLMGHLMKQGGGTIDFSIIH